MKTLFLTVALLGAAQSAPPIFGQSEPAEYKTAVDNFQNLYNKGEYENIFSGFSPEMQQAVPKEQANAFFTGTKRQYGDLKSRKFMGFNGNAEAIYKADFERDAFLFSLALSSSGKIAGFTLKPFETNAIPAPERTVTKLQLPFKGVWTVFWGGDTMEDNQHRASRAQKNAFDLLITDKHGKSFKTDGATNEDYYAFGKELLAPAGGEVVLVVDGIKDNVPGKLNPIYAPGNTVIIKTENNEYLFFAHFKQHSIKVAQGERVTQGQVLGLCGNSGNSSEPHLHFHVQNIEDSNEATGMKCFFDTVLVNGNLKTDYSPVRGDKVSGK